MRERLTGWENRWLYGIGEWLDGRMVGMVGERLAGWWNGWVDGRKGCWKGERLAGLENGWLVGRPSR